MSIEITSETTIGEILQADRFTARLFQEFGMSCMGCSHGRHESLEQACAVHDVNMYELIAQLEEWFAERENGDVPVSIF